MMSKTKTLQVEVVDDDLLKMLLEKISVLQSQVNSLQLEVNQLSKKNNLNGWAA